MYEILWLALLPIFGGKQSTPILPTPTISSVTKEDTTQVIVPGIIEQPKEPVQYYENPQQQYIDNTVIVESVADNYKVQESRETYQKDLSESLSKNISPDYDQGTPVENFVPLSNWTSTAQVMIAEGGIRYSLPGGIMGVASEAQYIPQGATLL